MVPLTRLMNKWLSPLMPHVPVPERLARELLLRDNRREHQESGWARLRSAAELGRYSVIRGWCQHFAPAGRILDVGCGEGILQEHLTGYGDYTGIDLFPETLARAEARANARTRFIEADAATFVPDQPYDLIVWNECLYYLPDPIGTIARYRDFLTPNGVIIVSMFYQTYLTRRLFRRLKVLGAPVAALLVSNDEGATWGLRAYRPHTAAASATGLSRSSAGRSLS
ncbi:MAG: class I SAM-dependent methyltransferase [Polyangiales bacterium]